MCCSRYRIVIHTFYEMLSFYGDLICKPWAFGKPDFIKYFASIRRKGRNIFC